jgi:hypothetical protein
LSGKAIQRKNQFQFFGTFFVKPGSDGGCARGRARLKASRSNAVKGVISGVLSRFQGRGFGFQVQLSDAGCWLLIAERRRVFLGVGRVINVIFLGFLRMTTMAVVPDNETQGRVFSHGNR